MAPSVSRYAALGKEATTGTDPASYRYFGIDSETVQPVPIQNLVVRSAKSQPVASHGYGIPSTGDIKMIAFGPADILLFLRGFIGLGSVANPNYTFTLDTPVAGVGQHVWAGFANQPLDNSTGDRVATETVVINYDKKQAKYFGCIFNSLMLSQEIGKPLEATWGVVGTTTLPSQTAADNTQNPPQQRGFGNYDPNQGNPNFTSTGSFDLLNAFSGGTSFKGIVKKLEVRIERQYEPNLFTSGSLLTLSNQEPGPTTITGTITTDKSLTMGANDAFADLIARTERGLEIVWNGDILTGTTRSALRLQLQNIILTGGVPHMRANRTPPGFEGQLTFEAYEATAPGAQFTVYGENTTIV